MTVEAWLYQGRIDRPSPDFAFSDNDPSFTRAELRLFAPIHALRTTRTEPNQATAADNLRLREHRY